MHCVISRVQNGETPWHRHPSPHRGLGSVGASHAPRPWLPMASAMAVRVTPPAVGPARCSISLRVRGSAKPPVLLLRWGRLNGTPIWHWGLSEERGPTESAVLSAPQEGATFRDTEAISKERRPPPLRAWALPHAERAGFQRALGQTAKWPVASLAGPCMGQKQNGTDIAETGMVICADPTRTLSSGSSECRERTAPRSHGRAHCHAPDSARARVSLRPLASDCGHAQRGRHTCAHARTCTHTPTCTGTRPSLTQVQSIHAGACEAETGVRAWGGNCRQHTCARMLSLPCRAQTCASTAQKHTCMRVERGRECIHVQSLTRAYPIHTCASTAPRHMRVHGG